MNKINAYQFVDKFELVVSNKAGSLELAYPKISNIEVFKRVLGRQYKTFVLNGDVSERNFANAAHKIAQRGMMLSKQNIETVLSLNSGE